jgi:(1->4)-alpha-D-glucan 1-alpha-D-glucosylmutase
VTAWRATYRLQLRGGLDLHGARQLAAYLERLGISHLYLSPILRARRGSTHGYDVTDPRQVDPFLGGERALGSLSAALRRRGMGILLDIVPNHMAADPESPAFDDVLAHGPASRFARWFDIDWGPADRPAPLRLPMLGEPLSRCPLELERRGAACRIRYFERSFALDPATLPTVFEPALRALERHPRDARSLARSLAALRDLPPRRAEETERGAAAARSLAKLARLLLRSEPVRRAVDAAVARFAAGPAGRRRLLRLLGRQAYRLEHWRSGRHRVNYRRFFDISDLIALRVEDPDVFDATHARLLELCGRGWLQGLRVDHVDGLMDPRQYLRRLRRAAQGRLPGRDRADFILLVEKILAPHESLPRDWKVDGTTGYEFLAAADAVRLSPSGAAAIESGWHRIVPGQPGFAERARDGKRGALRDLLRADVSRLARRLAGRSPGVPRRELETAIVEAIAWLPVYRTYGDACGLSDGDRRMLRRALLRAREQSPKRACAALERALLRRGDPEVLGLFQQLSGPAAAKGVEDTALYLHVPLVSRNEVGGEPDLPLDDAPARLHAGNRERARRFPRGLLAATTHDTKRSADLRARLDVLSEMPERWLEAVARWQRWNAPLRRRAGACWLPGPATEYLLYQTLVGVWPLPGASGRLPPPRERRALAARVGAYMEKACREAKEWTRWTRPDPVFESALQDFVAGVFARPRFLTDLAELVREIARPGLGNALSGTLLQLTAPGTPDLYQGDELWRFALVDPDNRRPVDFARRRRLLSRVEKGFARSGRARRAFLERLVSAPEDGALKLHLIRATLRARRRQPDLFGRGRYRPLRARGERADHVFAFLRERDHQLALVAVPRLPLTLVGHGPGWPGAPALWGDTALVLPRRLAGLRLRSALTGARLTVPRSARLELRRLWATLPAALCLAGGAAPGAAAGRASRSPAARPAAR